MLLSAFNKSVLSAAMSLLPPHFDTPEARVMLLAIGLQESELAYRCQIGGPAHGCWQFELTGVKGVLENPTAYGLLRDICAARKVSFSALAIYGAIVNDDVLAAVVARLNLWADPHALPALGDMQGAWAYYVRVWRPGKPRWESWPVNYARALSAIQAEDQAS